jgi:hypothetical protein
MDVTVSPELAGRIGETAGHLAGDPTDQATVPPARASDPVDRSDVDRASRKA